MPTGRVDSLEHRMMIGWEQLWSWYLMDVTRHAVASCRTRTARYHRWTVDSAPELFLMTSSFRNPPPVNQRHTHDTMWCVTLLTMLLLEVTRTSCCYHHLPLTAEVFFTARVVRIWNNLPTDVDFTSVSMSLLFYLFTFAISLWHRKFVTADVTAVFVNRQHGIQR